MSAALVPITFGVEPGEDLRAKIERLESAMFQMPEHHVELPVRHYFANGLYARELFIPKGTTLTGKIHKTLHINIISKGDISVLTENGIERIKAPFTLISKPGTKRVGFAHEDTVWTTFHGTQETDLDKLEAELIAESHDEIACDETPKQIEGA